MSDESESEENDGGEQLGVMGVEGWGNWWVGGCGWKGGGGGHFVERGCFDCEAGWGHFEWCRGCWEGVEDLVNCGKMGV